uniref:Uncharacterized protein n=1 Tax=Panagrolaimus sp. JU765 TaxID=591449 RepID=A0AC34RBL1_9BILA
MSSKLIMVAVVLMVCASHVIWGLQCCNNKDCTDVVDCTKRCYYKVSRNNDGPKASCDTYENECPTCQNDKWDQKDVHACYYYCNNTDNCNNRSETTCPDTAPAPVATPASVLSEHWCYVGLEGAGCKDYDRWTEIAKSQCGREYADGTRYCHKRTETRTNGTCVHYSCSVISGINYDKNGFYNATGTNGKLDYYNRCSGEFCHKTETYRNNAIASCFALQATLLMALFI